MPRVGGGVGQGVSVGASRVAMASLLSAVLLRSVRDLAFGRGSGLLVALGRFVMGWGCVARFGIGRAVWEVCFSLVD